MTVVFQKPRRARPGDLANATGSPRSAAITARQQAALGAALAGRLRFYPRGYAASGSGPFYTQRTILSLTRAGLLKLSTTMRFATATKRAREIYSS
ncbi:hypothetical protein [Bradyrhizobium sp. 2TAF24]|uniref:hypothetical protein n=1 Tax=Bradyrhizobium sp. 2TAF24 TaxID=3233011 RepID=UPI003F8F149D